MAGIDASALLSVKLKTTSKETRKDRSSPLASYTPCNESDEKEQKRREYFFSTGLDNWYENLKDVTIPSTLVSLTPDEARAILACWNKHYCHKSSHEHIPHESEISIPNSLTELSERISKVLSPDKGGFVKLSTRSPKDSHISFARAKEVFMSELRTRTDQVSGNDKLVMYGKIVIDSLKVHNGLEAMKLFVSSDRVGEDLEYALESGDDGFSNRMHIVVREWVDIPLWAEFRGFVWGGKLTTIGQYSHPVVFKQLVDKTDQIKSDLQQFFDSIKTKIPLEKYIVDFAWKEDGSVYLIEINPFDGEIVFPASTGLWSWDSDREVMTKGPLTLRIRTKEQSDFEIKTNLDPQWRDVIFPK